MRRVAHWLLLSLSAVVVGAITLAVALWLLVLVDPHTVLQSCGTGAGGKRAQECTPLSHSARAWMPLLVGLLGAIAGGLGFDRLTRRHRTPSDPQPPSMVAFGS